MKLEIEFNDVIELAKKLSELLSFVAPTAPTQSPEAPAKKEKKKETESPPAAAAPAAAPAAAAPAAPAAPAATEVTITTIKKKCVDVINKYQSQDNIKRLMAEFGIAQVNQLDKAHYVAFDGKLEALLNG